MAKEPAHSLDRKYDELHKAAARLLKQLDLLFDGSEEKGFEGWQNGHGRTVGANIERARRLLAGKVGMNTLANNKSREVLKTKGSGK